MCVCVCDWLLCHASVSQYFSVCVSVCVWTSVFLWLVKTYLILLYFNYCLLPEWRKQ